ncbi:MAG: mandelate racemase/muconate lactonizing enzyme family protein [Oscillospiraceae bacterium]|nr:mandelate racemase/muconate lactonizing enzyme family protein [Oscillospiraceae bacterium]
MKIINVEVVGGKKEIALPAPYLAAWDSPGGRPIRSFRASVVKVSTDEGIVGYGPCFGRLDASIREYLIGTDPLLVEQFWHDFMSGRVGTMGGFTGGVDTALWDIAGKAAGLPISKLLGAKADKVPVYAATSRLLGTEEHVAQALELQSLGFRAIKIRLHRQDYRDDLEVVRAVRQACPYLMLLVDANQNNHSIGYNYWDKETSVTVACELQALGVAILEEPRGRYDMEGLREISQKYSILISGGEHCANMYEFREHLLKGTYDIIQPDTILGNFGVTGMRKIGVISDYLGKQIVPHVCGMGAFALSFAATLQVMSGLTNCPILEFPHDPPFLTVETQQFYLRDKFWIDADGAVRVPQSPGLGVEIDEAAL